MNFTPIASSSSGNLYRLDNGKETLMIEAGLRFADIRKAFGFKLSELAGCLVTHMHEDHSRGAVKLIAAGVDVYMSVGTAEGIGAKGHRLHIVEAGKQFKVGGYTIMPFATEHDCDGSLGFLIQSGPDKLMFATDTYFIRYRFQGLTIIAVECNYDIDLLDKNVAAATYPAHNRNRVRESHMELKTVKDFLSANDLSKVIEIHLIHLSSANSDAERFRKEIQAITGKPVYIAGGAR